MKFVLRFGEESDEYVNYRRTQSGFEYPWLLAGSFGELSSAYESDETGCWNIVEEKQSTDLSFVKRWATLYQILKRFHDDLRSKYGGDSIEMEAGKNFAHLERMLTDQYSLFLGFEFPRDPLLDKNFMEAVDGVYPKQISASDLAGALGFKKG